MIVLEINILLLQHDLAPYLRQAIILANDVYWCSKSHNFNEFNH